MSVLTLDECWDVLGSSDIGRLAVSAGAGGDDGIDIFPINFIISERMIYFRSAGGSKLADLTSSPRVAFEVDGEHRTDHWSVVVKGAAKRMSVDEEILASGVMRLATVTDDKKWNYVRITPESVTGRMFHTDRRRRS